MSRSGKRFGIFRSRRGEGAHLAIVRVGMADVCANLDQGRAAFGVAGEEVHFVSVFGADVVYLAAATFEFEENDRFESVAEVGATRAFIKRDEARVYGIGFAGIDHALALGGGVQGKGPHQKSVLQMSQGNREGCSCRRAVLGI